MFCSAKTSFLALAILLAAGGSLRAQVEPEALRKKQETQQRAREMARTLVSTILDIQIQELEENGLQDLPLFKDVRSMRANLSGLVEAEMQKVIELLVKAQEVEGAERVEKFKEARQMIREIVIRLSLERQNLARRLKAAELSAQTKRLIELESAVLQVTGSLSSQPRPRQESLALSAIHDQRDVKALFLQLVESLSDVATWGGPIALGATEGLRILKTTGVGKELDGAGLHLEAAEFPDAAKSQRAVLNGLRLLLEKIEETQGLIGTDREAALEAVRDLMKREEKLREKTKQANLNDPLAEKLAEAQSAIRSDLGKLSGALGEVPNALSLLEAARAAAYEATGRIFDAKKEEAIVQEGKVLGNLAEIEEEILQAADYDQANRTADEYARLVKDLAGAREDLKKIREGEAKEAARDLGKVPEGKLLPVAVKARISEAEEAARDAAAASKEPAGSARAAQESAEKALERAAAEVDAAHAESSRRALAVKIGELARAAESLERAAAAERLVAESSREAAEGKGLDAGKAGDLVEEQGDIDQIARKVAEGVKGTVPEVSRGLNEAAKDTAGALEKLKAAQKDPGEPSKPAAREAARSAEAAAPKLAGAAAEIRKEIGRTAGDLVDVAGKQLEPLVKSREKVEGEVAKTGESRASRIQRLGEALKRTREASAEEMRAMGRPRAADALGRVGRIDEAMEKQDEADNAAEALAQGRASTALEATSRAQDVAEEASQIAKEASGRKGAPAAEGKDDGLKKSLDRAQEAAERAARETLNGNPTQAEAARGEAREALKEARRIGEEEAAKALGEPPGERDALAQEKAGQAAAAAKDLASPDAQAAAEALAGAKQSSDEARKGLEEKNAEAAGRAQEAAAAGIQRGEEEIRKAIADLAKKETSFLAEEARESAQLAAEAAPIDPGATTSLRAAEGAARRGEGEVAESPRSALPFQEKVQRSLERAAANLNAREERVRRDQAIAKALVDLAKEQNKAAEEIARGREALESHGEGQPSGEGQPGAAALPDPSASQGSSQDPSQGSSSPAPASPSQSQAVQGLAGATERFAQAQLATGQGAEEVSGQREIANEPIKEALELASGLELGEQGASPEAGQGSEEGQGSEPGQGAESSQGEESGHGGERGQGPPHGGSAQGQAHGSGESAMGSRFVPASPQVTARAMAGPRGMAQLAATGQGQGQERGQGQDHGQGQGQAKTPEYGASSEGKGAGVKGGPQAQNVGVKEGALEEKKTEKGDSRTPSAGTRDGNIGQKGIAAEPWFGKLPPELRKAIRADSGRSPPRGYEQKLRRYFESLDGESREKTP